MDAAEGNGVAAEVHDELAVAVDADDVAFHASEGAGEEAEAGVGPGELDEGFAEESDAFGADGGGLYEGLHDAVGDAGGTAGTTVLDQVVLGVILFQK